MNSLDGIVKVLTQPNNEIFVDEAIRVQAKRSVDRMLNFNKITA